MPALPLVSLARQGLYCPPGDFYIDPWEGVSRAVITHAHGDHARLGSEHYLTADSGKDLLRLRLGPAARIDGTAFGSQITLGKTHVSLHPAGHILGSAQVRIEHRGQICVVSGDYKTTPSQTAESFESIACHHFVSECT